ncbi:MAG: diacylglycerol kinase family lipid kinase [Clostridiales bacterium]|nr:diacylglycerol kinase family lipid kinase [Clostridiales bacterium]
MYIIANEKSGKGNGAKCLAIVKAYLDEKGVPYSVALTESKGHAETLAAQASANGEDIIVALGGDGTLHEVLNGIDFNVSRMGIIPAGRGNDFATGAKAASTDTITAISDIVNGTPKDLDYIEIADRRCINVAGTGLDVEVLLKTAKKRNKITYTASLFRCLLHYKPYHVGVTTDGVTTEYDCIMVGVCNGTQIGGGMKLSPLSVADDGKLDIVVVEKPKHKPTIFVMPQFIKGKHIDKPYTKHMICDEVSIATTAPLQLDGEIYYDLPFNAKIVKGGLKTFAPTIAQK